ncbi:ABC-F family ATP-binding cassette domain-containing protein [Bacillus testis]|uniref:ABC-F family ATP-binding cassette domain-containing protein n=1 Tax=Bacillus testis TaxID=1622072 RepID=UPI00067F1C6A|nr:ABC-F family ATP-binding cassette domain-containing protein [Bacillus testis]
MIVLQVNKLSKYFGAEKVLSNIKLEVQKRDRVGLVGRNGAGKSTLLKIIAGQLSYDEGEIIKPKDLTFGYLAQNTGLESDKSIWDEMLTVFTPVIELEKQLRSLEEKMTQPEIYNDEALYQQILKEYDDKQIAFKERGGYQYESDIRSVLHGLQFQQFDYETPVASLSGGQRTRLALGKLLLSQPDLLILDEPTNHLDIETLTWLEQYLQGYNGAVLIVSHDRYFMDKVVSVIYEISRTTSKKYHGNYSYYLEQKAADYERDMKQYEKQQDEIAKLQDFIQKNIARATTTKRAQSRRKQLERMDVMDKPLGDEKSASFTFRMNKQSGNIVATISDVSIGYEGAPISEHINMSVTKGESIALVGPNGVGKTTLLKSVLGKLPLLKGHVDFGSNVTIGYYDQEQANLSSNKRVLNELWDEYPTTNEKDIRTVLGNFLFSGDDVLKSVSALSGGEKARLALSKLMMQGSNFLILDEPTNHLDLDSKIVLENALVEFPGTILFVSHDRYFINRIASKVIELSTDGSQEFLGDYDYYVEKKAEQEEHERFEQAQSTSAAPQVEEKATYQQDKETKKRQRQIKRRLEEIETRMEELDALVSKQNELLCDPDIYQDHQRVLEINEVIDGANVELERLMEEWSELEEEQGALS